MSDSGLSEAQSTNVENKMNINNLLLETGLTEHPITNVLKKQKESKPELDSNNIDNSVLNKLDKIMKPTGYQEKIDINVDKSGQKKIEFPNFLNDQSFDPKSLNQYYKMPDISITVNNDRNSYKKNTNTACKSQKKIVHKGKKESSTQIKKHISKKTKYKDTIKKPKTHKKQNQSIKINKPLLKHKKQSKKCNINNIENHTIF